MSLEILTKKDLEEFKSELFEEMNQMFQKKETINQSVASFLRSQGNAKDIDGELCKRFESMEHYNIQRLAEHCSTTKPILKKMMTKLK